jgi:hypothetical protein
MVLKYPIDLENVSRTHLVEENGEIVEVSLSAESTKVR